MVVGCGSLCVVCCVLCVGCGCPLFLMCEVLVVMCCWLRVV